jgi:hypothetical protein
MRPSNRISADQLLECLKSMTEADRREIGELLTDNLNPRSESRESRSLSHYEAHQAFFATLTPAERNRLERSGAPASLGSPRGISSNHLNSWCTWIPWTCSDWIASGWERLEI